MNILGNYLVTVLPIFIIAGFVIYFVEKDRSNRLKAVKPQRQQSTTSSLIIGFGIFLLLLVVDYLHHNQGRTWYVTYARSILYFIIFILSFSYRFFRLR